MSTDEGATGAAATGPPGDAAEATDDTAPFTLGVLVIHGIGHRSGGAAVTTVSATIFEMLAARAADGSRITIESAEVAAESAVADAASEVVLAIHPEGAAGDVAPHRWVFRESWWGATVRQPPYRSMLRWGLTAVVRSLVQIGRPLVTALLRVARDLFGELRRAPTVAGEVAHGIASAASGLDPALFGAVPPAPEGEAREEAEIRAALALAPPQTKDLLASVAVGAVAAQYSAPFLLVVFLLLLAGSCAAVVVSAGLVVAGVLAVPVTALLLLGVWVAAALPRVGKRARALQAALERSVGDAYVWQRSPIGRAAILTRVRRDLDALAAECDAVAVIAHSQGAAVAAAILDEPTRAARIGLVVTYGQGLHRLGVVPLPTSGPRWLDFCADRDPVSVVPLVDVGPRRGVAIRNLRSATRDHSSYWANDEEFVAPLVNELLALSGAKVDDDDTRHLAAGVARRWQRVAVLTTARGAALALVATVAAVFDGDALRDVLRVATDAADSVAARLPGDVGVSLPAAWRTGLRGALGGSVLVAAAAFVWFSLTAAAWTPWDSAERRAYRSGRPPKRSVHGLLVALAFAVLPVGVGVLAVVYTRDLRPPLDGTLIVAAVVLVFGGMSLWFGLIDPTTLQRAEAADEQRRSRIEKRLRTGLAKLDALPAARRDAILDRLRANPDASVGDLVQDTT